MKGKDHGQVKIVGIEIDELYRDSLDAMICQAFSGGTVNNANGKINTITDWISSARHLDLICLLKFPRLKSRGILRG